MHFAAGPAIAATGKISLLAAMLAPIDRKCRSNQRTGFNRLCGGRACRGRESTNFGRTFVLPREFYDLAFKCRRLVFVFVNRGGPVKKLYHALARLAVEESGPTAVEYAVMLALIIGVCLVSVQSLANGTRESFDTSANAISSAL